MTDSEYVAKKFKCSIERADNMIKSGLNVSFLKNDAKKIIDTELNIKNITGDLLKPTILSAINIQ